MDCDPCSSDISRKRKKPDDVNNKPAISSLSIDPIDNEYEDLSDGDASDDHEARRPLTKSEMRHITQFQEASTVRDIGGITITPFNLDEECEEGEFDKAGNFIFKRGRNSGSDEEEDDNWGETVDWDEVKRREKTAWVAAGSNSKNIEDNSKQEVNERPKDEMSCYKIMLRLMKPNEIVKKTIRRLGDTIPKRIPVNKNKRSVEGREAIDLASIEEMRRNLNLMIELAHQRLEEGDEDIYQKSYDEIEEAINILYKKNQHV